MVMFVVSELLGLFLTGCFFVAGVDEAENFLFTDDYCETGLKTLEGMVCFLLC